MKGERTRGQTHACDACFFVFQSWKQLKENPQLHSRVTFPLVPSSTKSIQQLYNQVIRKVADKYYFKAQVTELTLHAN